MGAVARMVSGKLGGVQIQGLLKVVTSRDRFVVRMADVDDLVVPASDITKIESDKGFADNWPALRIDHTAVDVPTPIILFLRLDHPVCRDIKRLRPDAVVVPQESRFWLWGPRVARLAFGLAVVAAIVFAGVTGGDVTTYLPFALFGLLIAAAGWSKKW